MSTMALRARRLGESTDCCLHGSTGVCRGGALDVAVVAPGAAPAVLHRPVRHAGAVDGLVAVAHHLRPANASEAVLTDGAYLIS